MMAMMVGWMFVLHRLVGRPNTLPTPKWTFWRVFAYGKFIPTRKGRQALWLKMCEEGGVKPGDGIAVNPEDPAQALIVGPTIIANGGQQNRQPAASV
jgi:hypothetical protein